MAGVVYVTDPKTGKRYGPYSYGGGKGSAKKAAGRGKRDIRKSRPVSKGQKIVKKIATGTALSLLAGGTILAVKNRSLIVKNMSESVAKVQNTFNQAKKYHAVYSKLQKSGHLKRVLKGAKKVADIYSRFGGV